MRDADPYPTASRSARRRAGGALAAVGLVLLATGAACTATTEVETGSGRGVDGTAAPAPTVPRVEAPGQVAPAAPDVGASSPTTCVDGPATTTPWDQGGGRTTCSTVPPDSSVSSPPMTDTTVAPSTTQLRVDNTHGVLVVSATGGLECAADEACPAIGVIMQGTIVVEGGGTVETSAIDQTGLAAFRLTPGTYQVRAEVTQGSCQDGTATLGLERVDVSLSCTIPR